ncbi:MAG: hypothetical protein JKY92_04135 [Magnetovibrio sp.]|nr:hypothetical protein [Magnetovibrio sp.]
MDRTALVLSIIEDELAKPYAYGQSDCFSLACRLVDGLTGSDHFETYGSNYKTLKGAQRALRKQGHKSLVDFWTEHLTPVVPAMAQTGDLAILHFDGEKRGQEHCAICVGKFVTKTETGRALFPLSAVTAAFKV